MRMRQSVESESEESEGDEGERDEDKYRLNLVCFMSERPAIEGITCVYTNLPAAM